MNKLYIYGKHSFFSALKNPSREITNIFVTNKNIKEVSDFVKLNRSKLLPKIQIVEKSFFYKILSKECIHQELVLECKPLGRVNFNQFIASEKNKQYSSLIFLDQTTDVINIGAIMRNAVAFDFEAIIFPKHNSFKETGALVKASVGSIEKINLIEVTNFADALNTLKKQGYWVIGMSAHTNQTINKIPNFEKTVLILGSEGKGMRTLTEKHCDLITKIPMSPSGVESLNVASASAIACYEIYKNKMKD